MDRETTFEAWAPRDGRWTPWAKAILFAHVDEIAPLSPSAPTWLQRDLLGDADAIVVDLPGIESVGAGLALASLGYRPVPLFNAMPSPQAVVPLGEIVQALVFGARALGDKGLPADARPAFLLDSRRHGGNAPPGPGEYDNRSVVFETDFPSAARLREAGIRSVVVVRSGPLPASHDLAPILAAWQGSGLRLELLRADAPAAACPIHVRRPGLLQQLAKWIQGDPRPDHQGRFGRWVPDVSQGG